ncbi:hypothetical protein LCGC14_1914670 [marine sediment metagenome]|uniref:Uncharacterized protein n=1 Tax=marine sediment metagenome TaxID=412755 RepID=A0A0F9FT89_9ZZZZ
MKHGLSGTLKHKLWMYAKKRAKNKRIRFNISVLDLPDVPKYCPVLGVRIIVNNRMGPHDRSPSLDRIIPKLGYVKNNVRVISYKANRIRSNANTEELKLVWKDAKKIQCKHSQ